MLRWGLACDDGMWGWWWWAERGLPWVSRIMVAYSCWSYGRLLMKPSMSKEYSWPWDFCSLVGRPRCLRYVYSKLARQRTRAARTRSAWNASGQTSETKPRHRLWAMQLHPLHL